MTNLIKRPDNIEETIRQFETAHDTASAKVLVKYAPTEYIQQHFEELAEATSYFFVRLALPKDAPVDRTRLNDADYLRLCSYFQFDITEEEALRLAEKAFNEIQCHPMYVEESLKRLNINIVI